MFSASRVRAWSVQNAPRSDARNAAPAGPFIFSNRRVPVGRSWAPGFTLYLARASGCRLGFGRRKVLRFRRRADVRRSKEVSSQPHGLSAGDSKPPGRSQETAPVPVYIAKVRRVRPHFLWVHGHAHGLDELEVLEEEVRIPQAQNADQRLGVQIEAFAKRLLRISCGGQLKRWQKSALSCCGCRAMGHIVATAGPRSINFLAAGLLEIANAIDWDAVARASHRDHLPEGGFGFSRSCSGHGRGVAVGSGVRHPSARARRAGHPGGWLRRLGRTGNCRRGVNVIGARGIGVCRRRISVAVSRIAATAITTATRADAQRTSEYAPEADSDREPGPETPATVRAMALPPRARTRLKVRPNFFIILPFFD